VKRSCYCGEPRKSDAGKELVLCGWVNSRRDHGGVIFVDLRDRSGLVQVVFNPDFGAEAHTAAGELRGEYVIEVRGVLQPRSADTVNPKLPTGEVELLAHELVVLNAARPAPFLIEDDAPITENMRLKYRYLDLRRPVMQKRLAARHQACRITRDYLDEKGFVEVETPVLTRSTPEGARDYLVPSRTSPGSFFALPQSPQLFKQILMVGGLDRYYQIARCFRDEDLRADRQPEFTQIDLEMSFISQEDVLGLVEGLVKRIFVEVGGLALDEPFPRMPYAEAIARFGSDRPDTRFGLELCDLSGRFCRERVQGLPLRSRGRRRRESDRPQRRSRDVAQGNRRPRRARGRARREGHGVDPCRERRVAIADREVLRRRRARGADRTFADRRR
jgi:aspartyl-tRNA synthetase